MHRSPIEAAAVSWNEVRVKACAAPWGDKPVWTDLGAAETALSKAVSAFLKREAELAARVVTHVVHGMRFHSPMTVEVYSLDEAISTAFWGRDNGDWWPADVRTPAGEIVLSEEKLNDEVNRYEWRA
jgi:hypothetical protein